MSSALDEAIEFDTIKEAQDYAATQTYDNFNIYTMHLSGVRGGINWELETNHSANLRENSRTAAEKKKPLRAGKFTQTEIDTIESNIKAGMKIPAIAKALNRTNNSIYTKARDKGFIMVNKRAA